MIESEKIYSTGLRESWQQSREVLMSRWSAVDTESVVSAMCDGTELPRIFPPIEVEFAGRPIALEDLRGIDLRSIHIPDYDLAYCALDFSILDGCTLRGTHLQYSRLFSASLQGAILIDVQASPIDARFANLSDATLAGCFITNSNLEGVNISGASATACDFTESKGSIPGAGSANTFTAAHLNDKALKTISDYSRKIEEAIERILNHKPAISRKYPAQLGKVVFLDGTSKIAVNVERKPKPKAGGRTIDRRSIYLVTSAAETFNVGDFVEVVKYDSSNKTRIRGNQPKTYPSRPLNPALRRRRSKHEWMISRVLQDTGNRN